MDQASTCLEASWNGLNFRVSRPGTGESRKKWYRRSY